MARSDTPDSHMKAGGSGDRRSFPRNNRGNHRRRTCEAARRAGGSLNKGHSNLRGNGGRMPAPSLVAGEPFSQGRVLFQS